MPWLILLMFFPSRVVALRYDTIQVAMDYFQLLNLKIVCVLNCQEREWNHQLSRKAFQSWMFVSYANIGAVNNDDVTNCLRHKYTPIGVVLDPTCPDFEELMRIASENKWLDFRHSWLIIDELDSQINLNATDGPNTEHIDFKVMLGQIDDGHYNRNEINETGVNNKNNSDNASGDNDKSDIEINEFTKHNDSEKNQHEGERNCTIITEVLRDLNISVDTDIVVAVQTAPSNYTFYELFNFGKIQGGDLEVHEYGNWDCLTGIQLYYSGYKYYRRWDFKGWSMRLMVVVQISQKDFDPEMILGYQQNAGVPGFTKAPTMAVNVISEIHNFRFNYSLGDRWIGDFKTNDSKVVSTSLYFKEQDISPVIRMIPEVHEKIDVIHPPLLSLGTKFFYRIPTSGTGKLENQFLQPLSTGVWACVVAVLSLCGFVLLVAAKLERRPAWAQYAFFSVAASLCQQFFDDNADTGVKIASTARQLTVLVTGISTVLIYNYYTSSVVSWLLNGPPPSINSLEELLESPLELILQDVGYARSWIQTPTYYFNKKNAVIENKLRKAKIYTKKATDPLLVSLEKGIDMVKAGGYAFHSDSNSANTLISQKFTESELCELGSLQAIAETQGYPCLQKNSPYREFFVWKIYWGVVENKEKKERKKQNLEF